MPEKASEIALSEDSLRYLGLDAAVGDTVSLDMRVSVMDGSLPEFEYCGKFILTGILESSYIGYSTGTVEGIVGNGTAEKLLPEKYLLYSTDFKTHDKKNFQSIVYDLAKNLDVEDRYIQYNWILLDAVGISYDETSNSDAGAGFSFMTVACVLVGLLVLFAAGLVIYNILKISITKRIKEYGTLRAIGGERGQIYRLVSLQLLILCGIGIPIGLVLGTLAAKATLIAATGALNPDIFMANSVSELNEAISAASTVKFPIPYTVFQPRDRSRKTTSPCRKNPAATLQKIRAGRSSRSFPKKAFPASRNLPKNVTNFRKSNRPQWRASLTFCWCSCLTVSVAVTMKRPLSWSGSRSRASKSGA